MTPPRASRSSARAEEPAAAEAARKPQLTRAEEPATNGARPASNGAPVNESNCMPWSGWRSSKGSIWIWRRAGATRWRPMA